jgi:uncharacterized protein YjiS (DUF1127 family)
MSARSRSVIRLVRLDDTEPDQAVWAGRSNRPGLAVLDADYAARRGLEETGPGQAELQRESASLWWEIFAFFMEGFALYGAALHPTAAVPVHAILVAERDWRWQQDDRAPPEPVRDVACEVGESNGNVVRLDRFAAPPAYRWSWLHSLGETWTTLWSHLRREREIRQAVAALMELDDRTLRDLGIDCRSDVELMVRYCRDC